MRPEWGTYPEACLYCREMWARGSSLSRSAPVRDLLLRAKHLFVAARTVLAWAAVIAASANLFGSHLKFR